MCSEAKRIKTDDKLNVKNWRLKPVLRDDVLSDVPLVNAWVDKIKNKKNISSIISHLNKLCPVSSLQHLKRVRGDEILIAKADELIESLLEKFSMIQVFTLGLSLEPYMIQVPATPPRTKAQFSFCNKLWPCNFHPDKSLENKLSGREFTEENLHRIECWMRKCLELCQHGGVSCVVVDGESNQLIASGVDERYVHPLKHAAMVAIDNVAKGQGGGAWNENHSETRSDQVEILTTASELPKVKTVPSTRGDSISSDTDDQSNVPYLCTGYDVYLTVEPCLMCAMALVHSRAKRIFYGCPNLNTGALGSKLKLHAVTNLNHHYEVYAGVLEEECAAAFARMKRGILREN